jgi:electron transfer flavoprotein alpha subunit
VILVLAEHDRGALNDLSLQALTLGRRLAESLGEPMEAVVVGAEGKPLSDTLAAYGASKVHVADHEELTDYAPAAWAAAVVELIERTQPSVALAAGSDRGNDVMAHVAARLDLPMAANVTEVTPGETYTLTRTRWGGSLLEEATLAGERKLLTVTPHAVPAKAAEAAGEGAVETFTPSLSEADLLVRVSDRVQRAGDKLSLTDAKVVVGGGRGVGSSEGFAALEELAELLNGAVGCSRVVTSLGWRPHADQVGQTGQRIAPDLYIACGISGAIQHMVGCKSAKTLLVINTDPEAPILSQADYAIIGDVRQIVPALTAALRPSSGQRAG